VLVLVLELELELELSDNGTRTQVVRVRDVPRVWPSIKSGRLSNQTS